MVQDNSKSKEQKETEIASVQTDIARRTEEAKSRREETERLSKQFEHILSQDEDDADVEKAVEEVAKEKDAHEQLWASCRSAERELLSLGKLNIMVGSMVAENSSKNEAGMPQSVVDKVERMQVGDMTAKNNSTNRVGIFPG